MYSMLSYRRIEHQSHQINNKYAVLHLADILDQASSIYSTVYCISIHDYNSITKNGSV